MDPEQIILDEDFDDGSTDGGYGGEYDFMQQEQDALSVTTPLEFQAQWKPSSVSATDRFPFILHPLNDKTRKSCT